jgi:hypothetical protein
MRQSMLCRGHIPAAAAIENVKRCTPKPEHFAIRGKDTLLHGSGGRARDEPVRERHPGTAIIVLLRKKVLVDEDFYPASQLFRKSSTINAIPPAKAKKIVTY